MDFRKRILIGVPGTYNSPHQKNWIECESTWIPELRELGYDVRILLSDTDMSSDYKIRGNFFITNNSDSKDGLFYKNYYHISDYILRETNFDYYFKIDSDSFVHPKRFDDMILSILSLGEVPDYLGCCVPYCGWNPYDLLLEKIDLSQYTNNPFNPSFFASGAATFLSRKSLKIIRDNFNPEIHVETNFDDKLIGTILKDWVELYHDSRILFFSRFDFAQLDFESSEEVPHIGDPNCHIAIQHYCNGEMNRIMKQITN